MRDLHDDERMSAFWEMADKEILYEISVSSLLLLLG
jgi:hypothetical protein